MVMHTSQEVMTTVGRRGDEVWGSRHKGLYFFELNLQEEPYAGTCDDTQEVSSVAGRQTLATRVPLLPSPGKMFTFSRLFPSFAK